MSSKKLEAIRKKDLAETLIGNCDYYGARSKLLQAKKLFPELDHVTSMLAVCDILSAATFRFPGSSTDHYWVLQLTQASTFSDVENRYTKLVNLLRPITTRCAGASKALEHLNNAYAVLSDREKRLAFNRERNSRKTPRAEFGAPIHHQETTPAAPPSGGIIKQDTHSQNTGRGDLLTSSSSPANSGLQKPNVLVGEVWAVYHGGASVLQRYARINTVISASQVRATFLRAQATYSACGVFRPVEGEDANLDISQLSHLMDVQKESDIYKIYPRPGEVWAMCKEWSRQWEQSESGHCEVVVVEILSENLQENSITVAKLVKQRGYFTVFQRQQYDGFDLIRMFPETEMLSFSHRIPAFSIPGNETFGYQKNCWNLEPRALPIGK